MVRRPAGSRVAALAVALLVAAASGVAAGHAAALFSDRDLGVDAGDTVEVGITFHNVERTEFRLDGPDGYRLTGVLRNRGGAEATLALDTHAAGRDDAAAALRVSGATLSDAAVENASGADLAPGTYRMSLVAMGVTVDRGTLTVNATASAGGATPTADGSVAGGSATAGATTAPGGATAASGPGLGATAALVAALVCLLAAIGRAR